MKKAIPFLLLALLTLSGCSVKRNNFFSRAYHGTTTHYNYFFNGRERMRQGAQTLYDAQEDKYDRVLPIFKYGTLDQAKGVFPDMDEAIKKVSVAIARHSIVLKGRKDNKVMERNKWIDDCYLVMGKAQFYKHDYWTAIETFQYTSAEYKNSPGRPEALLWLTKSYLELGKVSDADYLLDYLKTDKKFPLTLKSDLNATLAYYHQQHNDVPRTIQSLLAAASTTKKRDTRSRYLFIAAQLYQKQGYLDSAFTTYNLVLKANPPYEMAFNARINRARCYDVNSGAGEEVKHELNKMLKDEKNHDYRDQIYYALAGIARQEKDTALAITYLNKSIQVGGPNTGQLALSYLDLGDIMLHRPEYLPAAAYYDSCLTNLSKDHPEYLDIEAKRNSLDRLVKNLKVIILEDSLQRLAEMSPTERKERIESIIAKENSDKALRDSLKKEKDRLEQEEVLQEKELKSQPRSQSTPASSLQGAWYFYNISAISFGYNEFLKRWGNRKLEDQWRRSEKELENAIENSPEEQAIDSVTKQTAAKSDSISKLDDTKRKQAYLEGIPSTPDQIKESNARLTEAYYNTGVIFREQIEDYRSSVGSFETLNKRFPNNKYKLPSYYNLYRTYLLLGDTAKANFYKDFLITNFPESEYSKLILNPGFYKELQRKTQVLEVFYENTYKAYLNNQFQDVIERKTMADSLFPPNKLTPKFALLKALAIGKTSARSQFELALEDVIRAYPKDSVSIRAKELLDYIKEHQVKTGDQAGGSTPFDSLSLFTVNAASPQIFLMVFQNNKVLSSDLTPKIKAFNMVNFQMQNLAVSNGNLDMSMQYLAVNSFKDKTEAMTYYSVFKNEPGLLSDVKDGDVMYFVITPDNLSQLVKTKGLNAYAQFFTKNYLQ